MDKIKEIPTRPLDVFEQTALKAIRQGEPLVLCEKDNLVRMMGGIRALDQCVRCYDCREGDLLGAFTYVLAKN